ncbi:MAG: alanyl-tRNA editing protein [Bacillota bacterium]
MTKKLYLDDAYNFEFKAKIKDCYKIKSDFAVILDKTYFYPEGGGQPCDLGFIDNKKVIDVYKYKGNIIHIVKGEIDINKEVSCKINKEKRFSYMQQHLGQHILSKIIENKFDADTTSFTIGKDYVTINIDKKLNYNQILEIEKKANDIIFKNLDVNILYPTKEELSKMDYRTKLKVKKDIRVIEIEGFDTAPCGGLHPKNTSEVGLLKIIKTKNEKNGIRIDFVCGYYALKDFRWKNKDLNDISDYLTTKNTKVKEKVKKLNDEVVELNKEFSKLKNKYLEKVVKELKNENFIKDDLKMVFKQIEDKSIKELRDMVSIGTKEKDYIIALISKKGEKINFVCGKSDNVKKDIRNYFNLTLEIINGNGGGNDNLLQGSGETIKDLEKIKKEFKKL